MPQATNSYMVVAEVMILVNSVGAVWAADRELPILYRDHRRAGNEPTFTATATLDQHTAQATGPTKNTAKTLAAAALLARLTEQLGSPLVDPV